MTEEDASIGADVYVGFTEAEFPVPDTSSSTPELAPASSTDELTSRLFSSPLPGMECPDMVGLRGGNAIPCSH